MLQHALRAALGSVGLLDVAREVRGYISSTSWLRDNLQYWVGGAGDDLPVPPLRLVRSSTGTSSLRWFLDGGRLGEETITSLLGQNGYRVADFRRILDFGCGCGRVIRRWQRLDAAVSGCDYNVDVIRWCRRHLKFASFETTRLAPPLPYRDQEFDLVYAFSVFTHLPEALFLQWLDEMDRILAPHGLLIISTHGEACLGGLTESQRADFESGRPVVKAHESAGTNRCGLYVSEKYVRKILTARFRVVDFVPAGAKGNPPQDVFLLQKFEPGRA